MSLNVLRSGRAGADVVVRALCDWAPRHSYAAGLHAGDVGWHLRLDDADLDDNLLVIMDGDEIVAVALDEGLSLRPTIKPERLQDRVVAEALANVAESMPHETDVFSDAAPHSAFRALLVSQGWHQDLDPWVVLCRPLTAADGEHFDPLSSTLDSDADIADRVAVQVAAFDHSTFTVPRWHQMAAGPGFDPTFEYLRRDSDGAAVAAATGWSAGSGAVAILEPVGTDRRYAGKGHGRAVSLAAIAALARGGASGVTVHTPAFNVGAVKTYEACGLRQVEISRALCRSARAE